MSVKEDVYLHGTDINDNKVVLVFQPSHEGVRVELHRESESPKELIYLNWSEVLGLNSIHQEAVKRLMETVSRIKELDI